MFYTHIIDAFLPEDNLERIETCWSFNVLILNDIFQYCVFVSCCQLMHGIEYHKI